MKKIFFYIFALSGLSLCLYNGAGGKALCLTTGCSVYAGYSMLGLSFYWWGAMAFAAILLSGVFAAKTDGLLPKLSTGIVLACDIPFLCWQTVFMPCSSCLSVAMLVLAGHVCSFGFGAGGMTGKKRWLPLAAGLLVVINVFSVGRELVGPWAVYGDPATAEYEIYFSLECPTCRETMQKILETPGMKDKVVLYPVAKTREDQDKFGVLYCGLKNGHDLGAALDRSWGVKECEYSHVGLTTAEEVLLWLRMQWNKALLVRKGYHRVPVLVSSRLLVVPGQCEQVGTGAGASWSLPSTSSAPSVWGGGSEGCSEPGDGEPAIGCSIQ